MYLHYCFLLLKANIEEHPKINNQKGPWKTHKFTLTLHLYFEKKKKESLVLLEHNPLTWVFILLIASTIQNEMINVICFLAFIKGFFTYTYEQIGFETIDLYNRRNTSNVRRLQQNGATAANFKVGSGDVTWFPFFKSWYYWKNKN